MTDKTIQERAKAYSDSIQFQDLFNNDTMKNAAAEDFEAGYKACLESKEIKDVFYVLKYVADHCNLYPYGMMADKALEPFKQPKP